MGRRLFQNCFENNVQVIYPETTLGHPGSPGLASEVGFWDPLNTDNTEANGKPPGQPIGRISPWSGGAWFNVCGSRWMDAVWVDQNGHATDMWDIKFGNDPDNSYDKDSAYRAIANRQGADYHGEFRVPDECDNCDDAEEDWQYNNGLNRLGRELDRALRENPLRVPIPLPLPAPVPVPY
ncbi:hypothetical protein [Fulvimarina sp. MAC8]|uniref:hypothetical protein n=1 Tax=Fulvimarina sp. MAC8 TaxID=3162874 RepID=UPI0032EDD57C